MEETILKLVAFGSDPYLSIINTLGVGYSFYTEITNDFSEAL